MDYDYIKDLLKDIDGWFLAGGYVVASMQGNSEYGDIDIFFKTKDDYTNAVAKLSGSLHKEFSFVKGYYGSIEEILESFDLNIVKVAYDPTEDKIIDMRDDEGKQGIIRIQNPKYYNLLDRIIKYTNRGFKIYGEEINKLMNLMTSDNLEEHKDYGRQIYYKIDLSEFVLSLYTIVASNPKAIFEGTKEVNYLMDIPCPFFRSYYATKIDYVSTKNQLWWIKYHNNMLRGDELKECMNEFPEFFV